jgi:hypothetical protein
LPADLSKELAMRPLRIAALVALIALLALGFWLYAGHRAEARSMQAGSRGSTEVAATTPMPAAPAAGAPLPPAARAADGAGTKPCSLVTRDEMQAILGVSIQPLTVREALCSYESDETHEATVETTWTGGKGAMADAKKFNGETMRAVPGLGDEAYFQAAGVMHVRQGDVYLVVDSRVYPNDEETETAIVRKALLRLK